MKKRWLIGLIILAVLGISVFISWRAFRASTYGGHSARYWGLRYCSYDLPVQQQATLALRQIGSNAVPSLVQLLTTTNRPFYERVAAAIAPRMPPKMRQRITPPPYPLPERLHSMTCSALSLLGPGARAAIPALASALTNQESNVPNVAMYALGSIGQDALPILLEQLHSDDPYRRRDGAVALGLAGAADQPAMPALFAVQMRDPQDFVRPAASNSLVTIVRAAPGAVKEMLGSNNPREREVAAHMAGTMFAYNQHLVPALTNLSQDPDLGVRREAVGSLARLVGLHPEVMMSLKRALEDPSVEVQLPAINGLARLKRRAEPALPALKALLGANDESVRTAAAAAINAITNGPPIAPPAP